MNKTLIIAAHPDDEVLGAGAVARKLADAGGEVFTLILSAGKASRGDTDLADEQAALRLEMEQANALLGVREVFTADFPDNAFDSVPLLEIVQEIETLKNRLQPDTIFTHHLGDMNIDHQLTHKAVLTATRPMVGECVRTIYAFEVPSSTEWNGFSRETAFVPNAFIDVSATVGAKIDAMAAYESELREYPHPRSLQYIKDNAKIWGAKVGLECAEAFQLVRKIG